MPTIGVRLVSSSGTHQDGIWSARHPQTGSAFQVPSLGGSAKYFRTMASRLFWEPSKLPDHARLAAPLPRVSPEIMFCLEEMYVS